MHHQNHARLSRYCLLVLALLLAVMLAACGGSDGTAPPAGTPSGGTSGSTPATATPAPVADAGDTDGGAGLPNWIDIYFTTPSGNRDESTYLNGPDTLLAASINTAQQTVDVAAFELNSPAIANALLGAHQRGVRVRMVVDDDHGLNIEWYEEYLDADEDEREDILDEMEEDPSDTLLDELYDAGIPMVDDSRSALMHNKFAIIDSTYVWMGSMNMTLNGAYRNNNNLVRLRNRRVIQAYQTEFNEMFELREHGSRSPANTPSSSFSIDGTPVEVYFAPEDGVVHEVIAEIEAAQQSIKFMTFSFTLDSIGEAMENAAARGIAVQGVFETTGSQTQYSELTRLYCAGLPVRQDGGPFILHHKVIIIDDSTVMTGSFNFSSNATSSNDENMMIFHNAAIAARYVAEYNARYAEGAPPDAGDINCN